MVHGGGPKNRRPIMVQTAGVGNARPKLWGLVGWEINVPSQHKNSLYRGQGLG